MKMKKILAAAIAAILFLGIAATPEVGSEIKLALTANAESGEVPIDEAHFPDEIFREYVKEFDTDKNGSFSTEEIAAVTSIFLDSKISSLKGIENFTSLTRLSCYYSKLTELDVSKNAMLSDLYCEGNKLQKLDVSECTELESLSCEGNQLTKLDVSKNTALEYLRCNNNQLAELDVSKNTALVRLTCDENQLAELDVSKNTALTHLYCSSNQLAELDVSKNTALEYLYCNNNQLAELDVSKNTKITELHCSDNQIVSLDLSGPAFLVELNCENNQFTSLDIGNNLCIITAYFVGEKKILDTQTYYQTHYKCWKVCLWIDSNVILTGYEKEAIVNAETFPDENFRAYVSENIDTNDDGKLTASEIYSVLELDVCDKQISSLKGIEYFPVLNSLWCENNDLVSIDTSKNIVLLLLSCSDNQLTELDVSKNAMLSDLYCEGNKLQKLDVSGCTDLSMLHCYENQLKSLDISKNTGLGYLQCQNNNLVDIDIRNNITLHVLECYGNQISTIDISNHEYLLMAYNDVNREYDEFMYYCKTNQVFPIWLKTDKNVKLIIENTMQNVGTADVSGMQNNPNVDVTNMDITFTDDSGKTYNAQVQANGKIMLPSLPAGEYTVTAFIENCPSRDYEVTVESGKPVELEVELKLYGDVDGNGLATTADLSLVNEQVQMLSELSDYDSKVADVNGDGIVTTSDLSAINEHVQLLELMW